MPERFYLPEPLDRPEVTLSGSEAHHLAHVLRIAPGAIVQLFDGEGSETVAEVLAVTKRAVTLRPRSVMREDEASPRITVAVAPPKGDRFRWLVEKTTELGVSKLIPLLTKRTVVDPRESKLDKLRQTMIGACKQCGRSRLMELTEPVRYESLIATGADREQFVLLHPSGKPLTLRSSESPVENVTLLIGPEGGFTDEEIEQATDRGVQVASMGRTILRTETAAIAAAAIASRSFET